MQPEPPPLPPINPLEGWADRHPTVVLAFLALSLLVSFLLIGRMWVCHRKAPFLRKLGWSFALLIPLAGWIAYGGLFQPLGCHNVSGGVEYGYFAGGGC